MQFTYLLAVIQAYYCKYLLKLEDNIIIATLQASSKTIACTQGCGLKPDWSTMIVCFLFVMHFIQ